MKSCLIIIAFLLCSFSILKSDEREDEIFNKIAIKLCIDLEEILKQNLNAQELEYKLAVSMVSNSIEFKEELKDYGFILNDIYKMDKLESQKLGEKLGKKLSLYLLGNCKENILKLGTQLQRNFGTDTITTGVTFESVKTDNFATVIARDNDGRKVNFLWLYYFQGSEYLLENKEELVDKTIYIKYYEKDIYLPAINDYFRYKIICKIEF